MIRYSLATLNKLDASKATEKEEATRQELITQNLNEASLQLSNPFLNPEPL